MKIFQNFLSKNKLNIIRSILEDDRFPYYYQDDIAFKNSKNKSNNCDFFFAHALFKEEIPTSGDKIIESVLYPITDKLNCKNLKQEKKYYQKITVFYHLVQKIDIEPSLKQILKEELILT